jgi:hypothetical protein
MVRTADRLTTTWFQDRVREANATLADGKADEGVTLLDDLAEECRKSARSALSEWHEVQVRWLLGSALEQLGRHRDAAKEYGRIARIRRDAVQEASHGLSGAASAAALCEFRAGNRKAGVRLALEALRLHAEHPLPGNAAEALEAEVAGAQRSRRKRKGRR